MPEPEEEGGGNFLTRKFYGVPSWAILAGVILLVYLFLRYRSSQQAKTQATTTPGTPAGTSSGLTSTLVGVQQPTPVIDGTYQVSVTPENQPSSIYAQTPTNLQPNQPAAGGLSGTDTTQANANSTAAVQPQTQSSSPQTQQSPVA